MKQVLPVKDKVENISSLISFYWVLLSFQPAMDFFGRRVQSTNNKGVYD